MNRLLQLASFEPSFFGPPCALPWHRGHRTWFSVFSRMALLIFLIEKQNMIGILSYHLTVGLGEGPLQFISTYYLTIAATYTSVLLQVVLVLEPQSRFGDRLLEI